MKHIFIGLVFIFVACTTYAEDIEPQQRPVLATAAYVQSAYETVANQLSVKQDTISDLTTIRSGAAAGATAVQPSSLSAVATSGSYNDLSNKPTIPNIPTGPNDGKYTLIWDGKTGQFIFDFLSCDNGYYRNQEQCVLCDKTLFNTTQTESVTNGTRSRSDTCTSVDVGATTCSCSNHSYGNWTYNCNSGYSGTSSCSCTTPCTSVTNRSNIGSGSEPCTISNGTGIRSYTDTCSGYYTTGGCSSAGASCSGCSSSTHTTGTCYVQTCNTGYYGTANSSTSCTACTNKPSNSSYTGSSTSNNCPWACDSGYTQEGSECVAQGCPSGTYDIGFDQCIDVSRNSTESGYIRHNGTSSNAADYGLTENGTWGTTLYTGDKVTGIASCNGTNGSYGVATDAEYNQISTGRYCWCKMTAPSASRWVFAIDYSAASTCANNCATRCGGLIRNDSDFRSGVFGSVGLE